MGEFASRSFRLRALWILLGASLLLALPALQGPALGYDDQPALAEALAKGPVDFFTEPFYYAYTPLYGLSFWLDGQLGASVDSPMLFRVGNVFWHAAACTVLFGVLALLLGNAVAALFGALLFAIHPLHVESVAWIAGRKDVLSGFFFFLAWLFVLKAEAGRPRATLWAMALFLAACFTKASAIVLPVVLLAAAATLPRYAGRRRDAALATVPFFALALVPAAVHLAVGLEQQVVAAPRDLGARAAALVAGWGGSLQRAVVPLDLSIDYPEARGTADGLLRPALVLAAGAAAWFAARRRSPLLAFALLAFFAALLPFNNVFPATEVAQADRYLYLPLIGVAAAAAWAVARWAHGAFAAGVVAVAFAALSFWGAARFRSDEELWTRTIAARDASAVAWFNRGAARCNRARTAWPRSKSLLESGVGDLRAAVARARLDEHRLKANAELVPPLVELGAFDEALERADRALALADAVDNAEARTYKAKVYYNRGIVHKDGRRDFAAAALDFRESGRLIPSYRAWAEAGQMFLASGNAAAAKEALEAAADLDRTTPEPWLDLAKLYQASHRRDERRAVLDKASARAHRDPRVVEAWIDFWLDLRSPDHEKARGELDRLPAGAADRTRLLGKIEAQRALFLFRRGRLEEAVTSADAARKASLAAPAHLYDVGQIYFAAGRYDDAVACYRGAAGLLEGGTLYADAVARAYVMKAYRLLRHGDEDGARRAFQAALDARPAQIEAGAAPLRGELEELRADRGDPDLPLLATAVAAGDPALGNRYATRILDREPPEADRILVYRLRALLRSFAGFDFGGAADDLQQVLARRPKDIWARFRLAQAWVRSGVGWTRTAQQLGSAERARQGRELIDRAIALFSELIAERPDFHAARLARGEARFAKGDISGAKADYLALRDRGAAMKETYLKEAVLHRLVFVRGGETSNLRSAVALLERSLAEDPNYFDALFELGNVYHNLYDANEDADGAGEPAFVAAILNYRRAMALNPRRAEPRVEWARICLKAAQHLVADGNLKGALDLIDRVREDAPDVPAVHMERVRLTMMREYQGQAGLRPGLVFRSARESLETVARLAPEDPELPGLWALLHRTRGFSYYLTWIRLDLETKPELKEKARQLAVDAWRQAIAAWPQDPENRKVRDRLRELAPDIVVFDAQQAEAAFDRGRKAAQRRRWKEAAVHFREAHLLIPESLDIRFNLALALARSGNLDEATAEFERVANAADGAPDAMYELGNIYLVRRQALVARVWYDRYIARMKELGREDHPLVARARGRLAELESR